MNENGKKPNSIIQTEEINKSISQSNSSRSKLVDEYYNIHTRKKHPATLLFIDKLSEDLKNFADLPNTLRISDFYDKHGIDAPVFYKWVSRFEELKAAHDYAKRRIAAKREDGALFRTMDGHFVARSICHYDDIYRQEAIFMQQLKNEQEKPDVKLVIVPYEEPKVSTVTPEEVAGKINAHMKTNHGGKHYNKKDKEE